MAERIDRPSYLNKLIEREGNGSIKVITGLRRCGKSYLLFDIFAEHLRSKGVPDDHIIQVALDDDRNEELLDRHALGNYVRERITDDSPFYVMLDEVQEVEGFERTLNGLARIPNADIYVTGSNSKFLSSDVITEFRGRGDEVRVRPLSFSEFFPAYKGPLRDAWRDYYTYGGLPLVLSRTSHESKASYLRTLFEKTYLTDVRERNGIHDKGALDSIVRILASSVGSLTNPMRIANTFASNGMRGTDNKTVSSYIEHLREAFLVEKVQRYDVKGRAYISTPLKYYFTDLGVRNAVLNFRQQEENHLMENAIYNELVTRGYSVDVGIVDTTVTNAKGQRERARLEVDFVCNLADRRYYVQSAYSVVDPSKAEQETRPLKKLDDSFKKVVVEAGDARSWHDEAGILHLGLWDFLLNADSLDW